MPLYEWLINKRLRYQYLTLLAFSILALLALYLLYRNTPKEGANKQVISSQADSLIKISRIWADFFPANTSNQPV